MPCFSFEHPLLNGSVLKEVIALASRERRDLWLVGGFLRDIALGRVAEPYDLDVATPKGALDFGRRVGRLLRAPFVVLDEEHGCGRVVLRRRDATPEMTLDFVDWRGRDLKEDLKKRDFTINTLAWALTGPEKGTLIDPWGGLKDLTSKIIRVAAPAAFKDDPLRILRAFSLSAVLGFKIEAKTLAFIRRDRARLKDVAGERMRDELFKIFSVPSSTPFWITMDRMKVLEEVLPQIKIMHNVRQGGYHHLDVWRHSLETLRKLEDLVLRGSDDADVTGYLNEVFAGERRRLELLKLAALLHDVGKPEAHEVKAGKTMFHGHERIGRQISKGVSERLKLSTRERFAMDTIIFWHLRPGYLADNRTLTKRAVHRYFRDTKEEAVSVLLAAIADQRATRGPLATPKSRRRHEKVAFGLIKRYFEMKREVPFVRLINGDDLIRRLKLKPGPIFAKILIAVEEAQVSGRLKTKTQALLLAKRISKKKP
jgi:poly(A) polymerase